MIRVPHDGHPTVSALRMTNAVLGANGATVKALSGSMQKQTDPPRGGSEFRESSGCVVVFRRAREIPVDIAGARRVWESGRALLCIG